MRAAVALAAALVVASCGGAAPDHPPAAGEPAAFSVRGRWPTDPVRIRYRVETDGSPIGAEAFAAAVERAAETWTATGVVELRPAAAADRADVTLGWRRGQHGACEPFGPNTDVAHTGPVGPGTFVHFDLARRWQADRGEGNPVFAVALHELGHVLGLGHSEAVTAVMGTALDRPRQLADDDLAGLFSLYGGGADADGDLEIRRGDARLACLRRVAPAARCGFAVFACTGDRADDVVVWRTDPAGHGMVTVFVFAPGPRLLRTLGPFYGAVAPGSRVGCVHDGADTRLLVTECADGRTIVRQFDRHGVPGLPKVEWTPRLRALVTQPGAGDLDGDGTTEQVVRTPAPAGLR